MRRKLAALSQTRYANVTKLTYEIYLVNPEIRYAIERGARLARNAAIYQSIVAPMVDSCRKLQRQVLKAFLLILTLANHRFYSPAGFPERIFNAVPNQGANHANATQ